MAKYQMTVGGVETIRQLMTLSWGRTIEDTYRGGKMLAVALPVSKPGTPLDDTLEIELDGPERDAVKKALEYGLAKETISTSKYLYEIITSLEFVTIPKTP